MSKIIAAVLLTVLFGMFSATSALSSNSSICERAASVASRETGIPLDVLLSITLAETGRKQGKGFQPWPWTVNMEGRGKWFDTRDEAEKYVEKHFNRGARSFDVGCFQINYRWHGKAFASRQVMFDPDTNAKYAARYLGELYAEFGDWTKAAGAYHSRTPKFAKKYAARFERIRSNLTKQPVVAAVSYTDTPTVTKPHANAYPLLVMTAAQPVGASLVPLNQPVRRFISLTPSTPLPLEQQ